MSKREKVPTPPTALVLAAKAEEYTNEQTDINNGEEGASGSCRASGSDGRGWWLGIPLGKRHKEAEGHLGIKAKAFPSKKKLKKTGRTGLSIPWTREASRKPSQPTAKIGKSNIASEKITPLPLSWDSFK